MLLCSLREPLPPPLTFAAPVGHQILDVNNLNGGVLFFQDMRHSKLRWKDQFYFQGKLVSSCESEEKVAASAREQEEATDQGSTPQS